MSGFHSEDRFVPLGELRRTGKDFLATLSGNTRAQIRRSMRRYAHLHGAAPRLDVARDVAEALD